MLMLSIKMSTCHMMACRGEVLPICLGLLLGSTCMLMHELLIQCMCNMFTKSNFALDRKAILELKLRAQD